MHGSDNLSSVNWPINMDFSYSTSSSAYSHGEGQYPIGDLNNFPDKYADWLEEYGFEEEEPEVPGGVFT